MRPIVGRAAGPIPVDFCPLGAAPRVSVMLSWWHRDVIAAGKLPLMLCFVSFVVTFVSTRTITRLIRDGRGPFRNVTAGGTHVHHSVPGIILLMIGAFTAVGGPGTLGWLSFSAIAVGIGTSLVLDEFALILHLQDVYWSGHGHRRALAAGQRHRDPGHRCLPGAGLHPQGQVPDGSVRPVPAAGRAVRRGAAGPAEFDLGAAPLPRRAVGARHPPGRGLRPPLETGAGGLGGLHRRPAVAAGPAAEPGSAARRDRGRLIESLTCRR